MEFWNDTYRLLAQYKKVALLYVVQSKGSSPGRQGFKMIVAPGQDMSGSIGGGIMEHKFVELSRSLLKGNNALPKPFIRHQVHRDDASEKSGMICSGEQTIAFYFLQHEDLIWLKKLLSALKSNEKHVLRLTSDRINLLKKDLAAPFMFKDMQSSSGWEYEEQVGFKEAIYIIGGGHVGLALSQLMRNLGFYVVVMDDREDLNTLTENSHAHQTSVIAYSEIHKHVPEGKNVYVVIASFGYRTDKVVLKQLLGKKYKYLGMMGSEEKVKRLFDEMKKEGATEAQLSIVHSPIGIRIKSKTPEEIAVSIAAEIIAVKNGGI
ncbi:hypothetical protein C900_02024 [Fulvivirga imtechensis AK7]|uniref:Xanthine and CO dehydrogenases maturation factor, XdhC/CoxF family n=1 Tax=Fulvivirga imtechensis AK7 TaxID=1237149 RepID=L8JWN2_9BACT|nr:XdhC/CoxI family protein [Fulvivirga imtechensis]ELR72029.1 hypothetical protein C900_02024 [Fulvivirga imtechensis AK7]